MVPDAVFIVPETTNRRKPRASVFFDSDQQRKRFFVYCKTHGLDYNNYTLQYKLRERDRAKQRGVILELKDIELPAPIEELHFKARDKLRPKELVVTTVHNGKRKFWDTPAELTWALKQRHQLKDPRSDVQLRDAYRRWKKWRVDYVPTTVYNIKTGQIEYFSKQVREYVQRKKDQRVPSFTPIVGLFPNLTTAVSILLNTVLRLVDDPNKISTQELDTFDKLQAWVDQNKKLLASKNISLPALN